MMPIVSVVVANRNGEHHLAEALRSILAQSLIEVEVLLVDDASSDRSVPIAAVMAANDPRLRIQRPAVNVGPAAARNHALVAARGEWIAVADSDDVIHPDRLRRLVHAAGVDAADIIADDLLVFHDDRRARPRRLMHGVLGSAPSWITPAQYVQTNRLCARTTSLGYLKPLIRASFLAQHCIRYAEDLRIAEDYDLVLRLLARGARFRLRPELLYFYRRHDASISHRLSPAALRAMVAADARARLRDWAGEGAIAPLRSALDARLASIHTAPAAEATIACLKARRPLAALAVLAARPRAIPVVVRLASPGQLIARSRRQRQPNPPAAPPQPRHPTIRVLTRRRLTSRSSGSAADLLSLCYTLRERGFALHLICPSPAMPGRLPVLRIAGEGDVFDRVAARGTRRINGVLVACDPRVFLHAAVGMADRLARRISITALAATARQPGVTLLGRVAKLAPLYRRADVVISPLRVGSGLKVKLIEALAHAKPVVATTVTAQGVAHLVRGSVALADTPQDFATEMLHLLTQPLLRAVRSEAALGVARRSFSAGAAYAGVIDHFWARYTAATEATPCTA